MADRDENTAQPLDAERLTWAVLLGRWTDFARSAVALPDDEAGRRLRDSLADLIGLQAVWFALTHLDELDAEERALGLARAGVLIDRHASALAKRYGDAGVPEQACELIEDAQAALRRAVRTLES
ncbi:hypothetical protein OT109_06195 [Phycisphaeraceae bacterium D3-23]